MAESFDPNSVIGSVRSSPKDLQLMANVLKDMGINDYEPRVLNQMLEFCYRYMTTILDDAFLYSTHAKKKCVDGEDVKLAITLYQDRILATPPARDVILDVAKQRNSMPLPQIKATAGLRLPPDRHTLISCNYRLKSPHKKRVHTVSRLTQNNVPSSTNKSGATSINKPNASSVPKSSANQSPAVPKPVVSISKSAPTPIIKFSDGKTMTAASNSSTLLSTAPQIMMPSTTAQQLLTSMGGSTIGPSNQLLLPTMGGTTTTTTNPLLMPTIGATTASTNQLLLPTMGTTTTSSSQLLMPTTASGTQLLLPTTPQIHMPTVSMTDSGEPAQPIKQDADDDDDYDMEPC